MYEEYCTAFFQLIPEQIGTVCARFGGCPSDYESNHDFIDLNYDYFIAMELNRIDQQKEETFRASITPKPGK